ncbi:MAG: transporter substrate-binding domain-containing protein [Candidatus Rokuibacteriota bacterium]
MNTRVLRTVSVLALALVAGALAAAPASANLLQEILKKGTVRVGVPIDVAPFGFTDSEGKPAGFDVDMANMLAKDLGVKLEVQQITGINRIPYLLTNKVDIVISVMGATPQRAQQVAFTAPYAGLFLGVYGAKGLAVKSAADLGTRKVGLPRGTTQDLSLTDMAPRANLVRFEDDATSAAAFLSGQTDLIATANIVALDLMKKNPAKNIELKFVIRLSPAHIAIRQGEPDLLRWLDTFIFFHKLNGNINKLHEKWFNEKMQDLPTF